MPSLLKMPTVLPRGSGYKELTETASAKALDLSNHLSEVPASSIQEGRPSQRRRSGRSKGILKEKNFWLFIISMFVFLLMFVCLRFLANYDPVRVRELQFLRTRYAHEKKDEFPLFDYPVMDFPPGIVKITEHVIANLTVQGEITFSIFSPDSNDKTLTLKAKRMAAFNCTRDGDYGTVVVEMTENVYYVYYFTPDDHIENRMHVDTSEKYYERSEFYVTSLGFIREAAFIGDDVYIRNYAKELSRNYRQGGHDYIELKSEKIRRINKLLRDYKNVKLIVDNLDFYFLCQGTETSATKFLVFIVKENFKIRGMYSDHISSLDHKLTLFVNDEEIKVEETDGNNEIVMDFAMNTLEIEGSLSRSLYVS